MLILCSRRCFIFIKIQEIIHKMLDKTQIAMKWHVMSKKNRKRNEKEKIENASWVITNISIRKTSFCDSFFYSNPTLGFQLSKNISYPGGWPKTGVGGTVGNPGVIGLEPRLSMLVFETAEAMFCPPLLTLCSLSESYLNLLWISGLDLS